MQKITERDNFHKILNMKTYAFPGIIDQNILNIGAQQIPYMRTSEFSKINKDSEKLLLDFIHCTEGRTIIYTGSGTGAMAAVVEDYVKTKQKAYIIDGGSFGHRWSQLCDYYGCNHIDMNLEFGHDIDYKMLECQISKERPDVFLCQHHETSSGQLYDLKKISTICHKYNVSIVVDVISSFLAEELNMDELDLDICITSTQKGLNIPPGLSILFFSKKLNNYNFAHNGYYWDFENNFCNLKRGQTPYSPATVIYLQLNERLHQIQELGLETVISEVKERSAYFRKLCNYYKWNIPADNPSAAITGFTVNNNGDKVFRSMIDKYNTFIMPSFRPNFFRVNHMGIQNHEDLELLAKQIHSIELE